MHYRQSHNFMPVRELAKLLALIFLMAVGTVKHTEAAEPKKIRMGYFEGGKYPYHDRLRDKFLKQLNNVLPDSIEAVFVPEGYRSAEWDKTNSGGMAQELALVKGLDLVVAFGPWVVQDLLNAGYKKPIVAMHQFAPQYEGLLDKSGKPTASNLTIHVQRNKLEIDLTRLAEMIHLKKLGLLYFPSSVESDSVLVQAKAIGDKLGFEVVTADGENAKGTFAFFNAYGKLDKKIDALYAAPLWGLDIKMINQFFYNTDHDRIPVMTSEDKFLVDRGAFLTNNAFSIFSEARFSAYKAARIILGDKPSALGVEFSGGTAIALNEPTARKCEITLERRMYTESDVVLAPPESDVPILSLNDAVSRAITFNPGFRAQREAVSAATAEASRAYAEYLPHLSAEAAIGYRDDNYVNNSRHELKNEFYVAGLNLSQKIFSLEAIKSIQIAAQERDLQEQSLISARLNLEQAVTRAFLNYVKAQDVLEILFRMRELVERNIEISGARFLVENGSEFEISRWRAERDKTTQKIIDAQSNLKVARILLNILINYPVEQDFVLQGTAFTNDYTGKLYMRIVPKLAKRGAAEEISRKVMVQVSESNPNLRQTQLELIIQKALLSQNKSRLFPTLDFQATLKHADELQDIPQPFREESDSWTMGAFLKLPIFDGTDRLREKRALQAGFGQIEFAFDKQKLELKGEVLISVERLIAGFDKLPAVNRRLGLSRTNLDLAVTAYDIGQFSAFNLLDEMREIENVQMEELATRFGFYESMAEIAHDMGWSGYGTGTLFIERVAELIIEN